MPTPSDGSPAPLDDPQLTGRRAASARAAAADAWLATLLGDEPDVALVAVGGYGRGELCPGSDLDVVLVHRGRKDVATVADRVWYPVWDARVGLDHSVRTVKEAVAAAADDLKVALGLLDVRHVAGDPALSDELRRRARDQWRSHAKRRLPELRALVAERHARFGEVAFLLEPDVKEGRGGLRDVAAVAAARVAVDILDDESLYGLDAAAASLLDVRVAIHRRTRSARDVLLLQEQDAVAADVGALSADELMASVASAARTIAYRSDDCWRRVTSWLEGPRGRVGGRDRALGPDLVLRDGEVDLTAAADVAGDASLPVRAAAAAAGAGAHLAPAALRRMVTGSPAPPAPWPDAVRRGLVDLLDAGPAAVPVLEALDHHGLLVRLLPEWARVRSKPQRNAYHRFTVDRHLCEAAANAAGLTRRVSRPDLLLVGTWLHDIGKGWPGDHTDEGVQLIGDIGARMGFTADDVAVLQDLVRHHLLLPDTATRRDLDDPATVEAVAAAVGDRLRLDLLEALTEADSLATGPSAWSEWKAGLVRELCARVRARLAGGALPPPNGLGDAERALLAERRLQLLVDGDSVTVVAPDRPGLFARVAGVLAIHGLDVISATAVGADGMALDRFRVEPALGTWPDLARVEEDLSKAVSGRLAVESRVAERARTYASRYRPPAGTSIAEPVVIVDNEASATATVLEVRARDGVGVLYRITRALADCDLDVRSARVATLGHEVVDAFYVTDATGEKIVDAEHLGEISRTIVAELTRA